MPAWHPLLQSLEDRNFTLRFSSSYEIQSMHSLFYSQYPCFVLIIIIYHFQLIIHSHGLLAVAGRADRLWPKWRFIHTVSAIACVCVAGWGGGGGGDTVSCLFIYLSFIYAAYCFKVCVVFACVMRVCKLNFLCRSHISIKSVLTAHRWACGIMLERQ